MVGLRRFGGGWLERVYWGISAAGAPQRGSWCIHVRTSMSTVTLTPAGNVLHLDCTIRRRQLQWRKYDPISILEVGSLSGCGLWSTLCVQSLVKLSLVSTLLVLGKGFPIVMLLSLCYNNCYPLVHMCDGYSSHLVCVCVYICYHAGCSIPPHLYVEITCIMWISLKTLCSVVATFADHLYPLCFLIDFRWTKQTAMASFQDD